MNQARLIIATLVLSLIFIPTTSALNHGEDFEDDTLFSNPTGNFYTYETNGGSSTDTYVTNFIPSNDGSKSLLFFYQPTASYGGLNFGQQFCDTGRGVSFAFQVGSLVGEIGIGKNAGQIDSTSSTSSFAGIRINADGTVKAVARDQGGTLSQSADFGSGVTANTWHTASISDLRCNNGSNPGPTMGFTACIDAVCGFKQLTNMPSSSTQTLDTLTYFQGTAPPALNAYLDTVDYEDGIEATPYGVCPDPTLGESNDWGYDYAEDVDYDTSPPIDLDLNDGFIFSLPSGDQGYLGKGFNPGSTSFRMNARLEAGTDGGNSVVRLAFTSGTTILSSGSTADLTTDLTAAGNGQSTGNFVENVQAVFTEAGDHWNIAIKYTDGGSLTQIGSSINFGQNPNDAFTFAFQIDSLETTARVYTIDETDGSLGDLLLVENIPVGLQDETWKDVWIIATGGTAIIADTGLDDSDGGNDNDDSSCIFDLVGTSIPTSPGSLPGSQVPDANITTTTSTSCNSFLCSSEENVPDGFTAATFNFFLGLLMTIAVAAGFYFLSRSPMVMAIGALVGYLLAWTFGLVQLWPLVLIAVLGVGIIFLKARPSGG